jgi:hypothetical protein
MQDATSSIRIDNMIHAPSLGFVNPMLQHVYLAAVVSRRDIRTMLSIKVSAQTVVTGQGFDDHEAVRYKSRLHRIDE